MFLVKHAVRGSCLPAPNSSLFLQEEGLVGGRGSPSTMWSVHWLEGGSRARRHTRDSRSLETKSPTGRDQEPGLGGGPHAGPGPGAHAFARLGLPPASLLIISSHLICTGYPPGKGFLFLSLIMTRGKDKKPANLPNQDWPPQQPRSWGTRASVTSRMRAKVPGLVPGRAEIVLNLHVTH